MAPASCDLEVLNRARGNREREVSMGSSFEREAREYARSSATACRISQELVPFHLQNHPPRPSEQEGL